MDAEFNPDIPRHRPQTRAEELTAREVRRQKGGGFLDQKPRESKRREALDETDEQREQR